MYSCDVLSNGRELFPNSSHNLLWNDYSKRRLEYGFNKPKHVA